MNAESAELESAIRQLAKEFADASGQIASIPAPRHMRRARKLVEAGWNRRCFTCENRAGPNIIGV